MQYTHIYHNSISMQCPIVWQISWPQQEWVKSYIALGLRDRLFISAILVFFQKGSMVLLVKILSVWDAFFLFDYHWKVLVLSDKYYFRCTSGYKHLSSYLRIAVFQNGSKECNSVT